jgi:chromosome segregation ATPase
VKDADFLTEKNNQILSLSAQLGDARLHIKELQKSLTMANSRLAALQAANDRLGTDLFKADALLDRMRVKLTGVQ